MAQYIEAKCAGCGAVSEAKLLQIAQVWENDHQGCGIPLK